MLILFCLFLVTRCETCRRCATKWSTRNAACSGCVTFLKRISRCPPTTSSGSLVRKGHHFRPHVLTPSCFSYKNIMVVRDAMGGKKLELKEEFDDHAKWGVCQVPFTARVYPAEHVLIGSVFRLAPRPRSYVLTQSGTTTQMRPSLGHRDASPGGETSSSKKWEPCSPTR